MKIVEVFFWTYKNAKRYRFVRYRYKYRLDQVYATSTTATLDIRYKYDGYRSGMLYILIRQSQKCRQIDTPAILIIYIDSRCGLDVYEARMIYLIDLTQIEIRLGIYDVQNSYTTEQIQIGNATYIDQIVLQMPLDKQNGYIHDLYRQQSWFRRIKVHERYI